MMIEIKPLLPNLARDYFDFHENHAFTDHVEWTNCYCIAFCMGKEDDENIREEMKNDGDDRPALHRALKSRAEKYISNGALHGYLAYADGVVVGWCNANDKADYTRFTFTEDASNYIRNSSSGRVKSVLCFCIAPGHRNKGVATALLKRVIQDAKAEGYDAVEGYARQYEKREPFDFNGPKQLFENTGFTQVGEPGPSVKGQGAVVIMRKELALNTDS